MKKLILFFVAILVATLAFGQKPEWSRRDSLEAHKATMLVRVEYANGPLSREISALRTEKRNTESFTEATKLRAEIKELRAERRDMRPKWCNELKSIRQDWRNQYWAEKYWIPNGFTPEVKKTYVLGLIRAVEDNPSVTSEARHRVFRHSSFILSKGLAVFAFHYEFCPEDMQEALYLHFTPSILGPMGYFGSLGDFPAFTPYGAGLIALWFGVPATDMAIKKHHMNRIFKISGYKIPGISYLPYRRDTKKYFESQDYKSMGDFKKYLRRK